MIRFQPGDKVVCVNDYWFGEHSWDPVPNKSVKGTIYTVRDIFVETYTPNGGVGYIKRIAAHLVEVVNPVQKWDGDPREIGFPVVCFEPVVERKTDISMLEKLLSTVSESELVKG